MKYKLWPRLIVLLLLSIATWFVFNRNTEDLLGSQPTASLDTLFVKPNGEVTDPIVRLLGLTGIRVADDPLSPEKDWAEKRIQIKSRKIEDVVPAVQGKVDPSITWFGDPSKERWEKDPKKPDLSPLQARAIIEICFESLRQKDKMYPHAVPKAILFLGAALSRVRMRLSYLNELYETNKIPTDLPVYLLMGERKLEESVGETQEKIMDPNNGIIPFREDWKVSGELITDEGDMIKLVFSQSRHKNMDQKNIKSAYSSKGSGRRSTAETNVNQWLKEYSPPSGTYVAISNQPYNFYQEIVIRRVLLQAGRSDITVEVVGPAIDVKLDTDEAVIHQAKNLLNNLSRILYEFQEIRKMAK